GPFGNFTKSYIGHTENAGLFLHRSTIRKQAERALFETDKVEEPERLEERNSRALEFDPECVHLGPRAGMQGTHNRKPKLLLKQFQCFHQRAQAALNVHVFSSVNCHEKELPRLQAQLLQGRTGSDLLRIVVNDLLNR